MAININTFQGALGSGLGQMAQAPGSNGPAGPRANHTTGIQAPLNPSFGDLWSDGSGSVKVYTQQGWVSVGMTGAAGISSSGSINASIMPYDPNSLSIGNQTYAVAQSPTTSVIAIETKVGRVGINTETGDITIPPGIGRDEAIREFWFGFQKHFQPANKDKYEKEIAGLKSDYQRLENYYKDKLASVGKDAAKPIIEKVRKKYGNEKFIMVKPEDLIKFIEGA
jgi:hypothetical protein